MALNRLIDVTFRDIAPTPTFDPVLQNSGYADVSTTEWRAVAVGLGADKDRNIAVFGVTPTAYVLTLPADYSSFGSIDLSILTARSTPTAISLNVRELTRADARISQSGVTFLWDASGRTLTLMRDGLYPRYNSGPQTLVKDTSRIDPQGAMRIGDLALADSIIWRRALTSEPRGYDAEQMRAFLATGPQSVYILQDAHTWLCFFSIDEILDDAMRSFAGVNGQYERMAVSGFATNRAVDGVDDLPVPVDLGFSWALAQQTLGPSYTLPTWAEVQGLPTSQGLVSVLATGGTLSAFEEVQQVRTARIRHVPGRQPVQFRHDNILWTVSSVAPSRDGRFIDVEGFAKIAGGN